jgi:hypothetical protein
VLVDNGMGNELETIASESHGWTHDTKCTLVRTARRADTFGNSRKVTVATMNRKARGRRLCVVVTLFAAAVLALPAVPAGKNLAVVTAAGSKLQDVPLAELVKMCKGTQKAWSDGRSFTLVMKDPESPELHIASQKLFGVAPGDMKASIAKVNESRQVIKIVESDEELLRTVEATPGAVGILDVYAITSSVKVLRVDGKLPFDPGYVLKGN